MQGYKHLSLEEREKLYALKAQGLSLRNIAKVLGRSGTTLGRELERNRTGVGKRSAEYLIFRYTPCKAQEKADKKAAKQRTKAPLKEPAIFLYVREHLREPYGWSPDQIAERLKLDYPGKNITKETIYQYIYSKKAKRYQLWKYLTLGRKKRMKKEGRRVRREGKILGAISIDLRPKRAEGRKEVGHWETDLVIGKQTDKSALSVTVERTTRFTIIDKLPDRSAVSKTDSLVARLSVLPTKTRSTLTADNGKEMSYHSQISQELNLQVYFCHAYHSWEKGTVENTNGRIRRYIPKGASIDTIADKRITAIERRLNSTPRKCLGYLTPYEKIREVISTDCCTST